MQMRPCDLQNIKMFLSLRHMTACVPKVINLTKLYFFAFWGTHGSKRVNDNMSLDSGQWSHSCRCHYAYSRELT